MKNSEKTCFFFFFVEFKKTREYSSRSLNLANFSIFVGRIWILKRGGDFDIFFFSKGRWGEASPFSIFFASTSPPPGPLICINHEICHSAAGYSLPLSSNKAPLPPRSSQKFYFSGFLFARSLKFVSLRSRERSRSARSSHFSFPRFLLPFPFRSFFKFERS